MTLGDRLRRWLLCLSLAVVSFLAVFADNVGIITLGPPLTVIILCLGTVSLLAMIKDW